MVSPARVRVHQYESACYCNVVKKAVGFNYVPPDSFVDQILNEAATEI
jgi:hypothetical protein